VSALAALSIWTTGPQAVAAGEPVHNYRGVVPVLVYHGIDAAPRPRGPYSITQAEFDRTIVGAIRALPGNFETSSAVLSAMQSNDLYRRPDNYYATITQKYRALTLPQLDAAARGAIDPNKFIWIVVGDAAKVRPQLDSLGLPVEVVTAASVAEVR